MSNTVATWGGLEIQLVSEPVIAGIDAVRTFLGLVNNALSIALQVSEIAKTFVVSNLDLVRAAANELSALLRNIIRDFFSLGFSLNFSDFSLIRTNLNSLKGGYPAWERRMITRLTDRRDPNCPDFTPSTTVLALFFYVGVQDYLLLAQGVIDRSKYEPILQSFRSIQNLFGYGFGPNPALPVAVNLRAEYALPTNASSPDFFIAASSLVGRNRAKVIWNSAPAPGGDRDTAPQIPPAAFIVEVSCYARGFQVGWIAPAPAGTGTQSSASGSTNNQRFITGRYLQGNSADPLAIFGGEDAVRLDPDVQWPSGYTPGTDLPTSATPAYFFRDAATPEVIRKPFGKSGNRYFNQRRFYVPKESNLFQMLAGGNYSLDLDVNELPRYCPIVNGEIDTSRAVVPSVVYVRVIPVTDRITADNYNQARWYPRPHRTDNESIVGIDGLRTTPPISASDFGTPSEVLEVTVPLPQPTLYAQALQTAIAMAVLSRSDLTQPSVVTEGQRITDPTYRETGLESIAREIFTRMGIPNPENYFVRNGISPRSFVADLYPKIVAQADRYIRTQGELPAEILQSLEPTLQDLTQWKWSDTTVVGPQGNSAFRYTILESLNEMNANTPLSMNRKGTRRYYSGTPQTPDSVLALTLDRWRNGTFGRTVNPTSLESSPVIGPSNSSDPQYWFARDLIPAEMYAKARAVLSLTADQSAIQRTPQTSWYTRRVFAPLTITGSSLTAITKAEQFVNVALTGLQNVADGILRVISFLEQRVREVQELIRSIETLLDIPYQITFPSVKALVLITNGTAGVVSGLVSSQEKPQEGANDYAAGGVMVAGGAVPSILVDVIAKSLTPASGG